MISSMILLRAMLDTIMIKSGIKNLKFFEPFLWAYYIWYYLPICRGFFRFTSYNKAFFSFYIVGCFFLIVQLVADKKKIFLRRNILFPIFLYMIVFAFMYLLGIGDASAHIRVSFTFWGTAIVFFAMTQYEDARRRLAKLLLILFGITTITSIAGVILNPHAARTLTYAENALEEDQILQLLNIGDISFFQSLVVCIPIFITFIHEKRKRFVSLIMMVLIFIAVMSASFTISLLMFFVAWILTYVLNCTRTKRTIVIVLILFVIICVPWMDLIDILAVNIKNETIALKLDSIVTSFSNESATGSFASRLDTYSESFNTFLRHPLGVGPKYTYVMFANGIGYHSQILDDLARYGLFALVFYILLFTEYHKMLKKQWCKIGMAKVATPITIVYMLFLILNLGFTSAYEGVMMFFLIPSFPDVIGQKKHVSNKLTS